MPLACAQAKVLFSHEAFSALARALCLTRVPPCACMDHQLDKLRLYAKAHINTLVWAEASTSPQTLRAVALQVATAGAWWPQPPEAVRLQLLNTVCCAWAQPRVRACLQEALQRARDGADRR